MDTTFPLRLCASAPLRENIKHMKNLKSLILGSLFGMILVKAEVVSWFRIQEMFRFQSIFMFGIIGLAMVVGLIATQLIKRMNVKALDGSEINMKSKPFTWKANLIGGILFGFGWALTGACPGPIYSLIGSGYTIILVPLLSAILGAYVYGLTKDKLPH